MKIKIDHIAKIEGHAGFMADIANGRVKDVRLEILEGARLLEGILRDRNIYEVSHITARICGVCPVVHTLTSLKALEKALDVQISESDLLLRKILMLGQLINSHALHLFFFSLSDFFGFESDLTLIEKYPERAKDALAVREFGNKMIEVIGGRSIHPVTMTIGGFLKKPRQEDLHRLSCNSENILKAAKHLAQLFVNLKYPDFTRSGPYASLYHKKDFAIYDGDIKTSADEIKHPDDFMDAIKEFQVKNSPAIKGTLYMEKPFMVGALPRINNGHANLNPEAKKILKQAKIHLPSFNPFHNILAQAIEMVHCLEEARKLLKLASRKQFEENPELKDFVATKIKKIKGTARGAEAIEAPRGTLYYFYEIGPDGMVKNCNIITPTAQNLARIEKDLEEYMKIFDQKISKKSAEDKIKMLIRAYDPCLTCATH